MTTAAATHFSVFSSSFEKGKLTLYITAGELVTWLKITPERALELAADIRREVDAMPRHRTGTPADLGYEEAA